MAAIVALGLAYVLSQFYRVFLAVLAPYLAADLDMAAASLGWASAAWFAVFALMQFPVGVALDRLGPRRTAGWLTIVAGGGGALVFAAAPGPAAVVLAMGLIGAGCAPAMMAALYLFARRFPPARFAALGSTLVGVGALGNAGAAAPLALAADAFGWRAAMVALAGVAAVIGLVILRIVDDPAPAPRDAEDRGFGDYLTLLAMPHMWPIYLMMMVNYAPVIGVRGLWAGPYLSQVFDMDGPAVGLATLWMAGAMAAGSFAYAPLDHWLGTRKWVVAVGTLLTALACAALAVWVDRDAGLSVALLALLGFVGISYGVIMAHARPFFPAARVGRGVTLMNFFCMMGVGAGQAVGGALVSGANDPAEGFAAVFTFYAVAALAATALYAFSRDSRS